MRKVFIITMVVLLMIAVVPSAQTAEPQPVEDHNWGGDPDDPACEGWVQLWWYVMNVLYFYPLDVI